MKEAKDSPLLFLLLTFLLTWLLWICVALIGPPMSIGFPLVIFGAFIPSFTAVGMVGIPGPKERRRDFWRRVISLRKIGWKWFLVIILFFPVMGGIAYLIHLAAGGNSIRLDPESYGSIGAFLLFAVFIFIGGPLGEELGWRGFLLERLQRRWKPLTSSLVLGIIWVIWHFPLFFIPGTAQYTMEFLSLTFFQWVIQVMCLSIILSWVFNNTGGSILSAVLLHFMTNFTITSLEGVDGRLSRVMGLTVTILHVLVVISILFYKKGMRKGYT